MGKNKKESIHSKKTTMYGEMVPSTFNWITPDIQEKIANRLANVTKSETSDELSKKNQ